jgi:hypothetical protein
MIDVAVNQTDKLICENERLRIQLRKMVEIIEKRLNEPWIEILHAVQEAKVELGDDEP